MDGSLDTKKILKAIKNGELTAEEGLRLIDTKKADNISQNVEIAVEKGQNISKTDIGYIDTKVLKIKTVEYLKGVLSKDLDIPAHKIDEKDALEKYGIDSVMVVGLTRELEKNFGELSKTLFFEYQTINDLADYFAENHSEKLIKLLNLSISTDTNESIPYQSPATSLKTRPQPKAVDFRKRRMMNRDDIAIIGVSGRYPMSSDLDEFWENLKSGRDCIIEIPESRWDSEEYYDPERGKKGKTVSKWGAFIEDVDKFDPLFFNISPREAEYIDPQERLFLQTVWHSIEDAGYTRNRLSGSRVGVFVGIMYGHYQLFGAEESQKGNVMALNSSYASIANRVSYYFNFQGPSIGLDTMCSSSLTAIHLACESLNREECRVAVAGGVNTTIHPNKYILLGQANFASSDGRCRSFGEGGDGYVPGEGVGAVVLKRLGDAIEDRDRIYATIKSSAVNHGGKTNGYTVPNPNAQADIISEAIRKSGINPRSISYIEAHGTGTSLGDPIEITGLKKAFSEYTNEKQFCAIGSVKSNIGHLESAAGIAGLTKILLQFKHSKLVPSIHSEIINPNINFKDTPFAVQRELEEWNQPEITENGVIVKYPRRAGISSFGAGGSNAHIILEEYIQDRDDDNVMGPFVVPISAKNKERLKDYANALIKFIERNENMMLKDIAYTFQTGREAMDERIAIVASDTGELKIALKEFVKGDIVSTNVLKLGESSVNLRSDLIAEGEEGEEFIRNIIKNRKIKKIARLWEMGVDIDWRMLYDVPPMTVTLPFYPFAKERYWVPVSDQTKNFNGFGTVDVLGVMIDSNESTLEEQCYKKLLTGREFFLKDHIVMGQATMPGAAFIEMARTAGSLALKGARIGKIKDVVFNKILAVSEVPVETYVRFLPKNGYVEFLVTGSAKKEDAVIYCSGRIEYAFQQIMAPVIEVDDILSRKESMKVIDRDEFYGHMQQVGFDYKKSFKTVKTISYSDTEVLVRLETFFDETVKEGTMELHPSVLDGAFQAVVPLLLEKIKTEQKIYFPYSVGEISIYSALEKKCLVYATFEPSVPTKNKDSFSFNVKIMDDAGKLLVEIKNYTVKKSMMNVNEDKSYKGQTDTVICSVKWEKRPTERLKMVLPGDVLVFDVKGNIKNTLLEKTSGLIASVTPGTDFKEIGELEYEICPQKEENYLKLLSTLTEKGFVLSNIFYLWLPLKEEKKDEGQISDHSAKAVFLLSKALMKTKRKKGLNLVLGCFAKDGTVLPQYAAVSGIAKTLTLEDPAVKCRTILFGKDLSWSHIPEVLLQEIISGTDKETDIKYENGERYVKKAVEITHDDDISNKGLLKEGSVCLIAGGMGGLGIIFAKHLAKDVKAKLILCGRSTLSDTGQKQLKELENLGTEVIYIKADISRREDAFLLVDKAKERFSTIDCIIQSAGVLKDSLIINKSIEEFEAVTSPKVEGTLFLNEALENFGINPEYFILFSSITALAGNVGQVDYAYANSFIDYFAEWRSKSSYAGKTVSINWPLWNEGGMSPDAQSIQWMKENLGMWPLSKESGIATFQRALNINSDYSQLVVLEGDGSKMRHYIGAEFEEEEKIEKKQEVNVSENDKDVREEKLKQETIKFLKTVLSKEMRISSDRLEEKEPLEKYGIDSIMIVGLIRELESEFGQLPKTLFFEYQNISQLSDYFIEKHRKKLIKKIGYIEDKKEEKIELKVEGAVYYPEKNIEKRFLFQQGKAFEDKDKNLDIAIIGLSGRYPMADSIEEFWANLELGKDCISKIPSDRWDAEEYFDKERGKRGKSYSKWGGFINNMDKFDPLFFNISPVEAHITDPQERLFLQTVWHTMEDAGYTREKLAKFPVGVFVGVMYGHYQMYGAEESMKNNVIALSSSFASIANRVSYFLNLRGPSISLDTMCSSSLTSLHLACESIKRGECKMAFSGGVNLSIHPNKYILLSQGKFFSSDGRCRSFGEGGDGYVPGEGVGAVLLKPLHKAEEDGDRIYGVIKSIALNHGGKTNGYTVPNPNAQAELVEEALNKAGINPRTISYIEAHGTGTALGDPIEISGLTKSFEKFTQDKQFCHIGSVKSNIGHLESAAGIAGITKVLLQMRHKKLVPSIHSETLNSNVDFVNSPFSVQRKLESWERPLINENGVLKQYPRRAGISSFGAGGSNAHVIIEEYTPQEVGNPVKEPPYLFTFSAKNKERLFEYVSKMLDYVRSFKKPLEISSQLNEEVLTHSLKDSIVKILSEITSVPVNNIDNTENIDDMGLDIISLTKLTDRLNSEYGINLEAASLRGSPEQVTAMLISENREVFQNSSIENKIMKPEGVTGSINLEGMAFTLQTGREAMEERLVVIATEQNDLEEKLSAFISGSKEIGGTYCGNVKNGREKVSLLLDGSKAVREFIMTIIKERQYEKLAQFWVAGIDIDFSLLYGDRKPLFEALPLYPFAQERYWVPQTENNYTGEANAYPVWNSGNGSGEKTAMVLEKVWRPCVANKAEEEVLEGTVVFIANRENVSTAKQVAGRIGTRYLILKSSDKYNIISDFETELDLSSSEQGLKVFEELIVGKEKVISVIDISDAYEESTDMYGEFKGKVALLQNIIKFFGSNELKIFHITRGLNTFLNDNPTLSGSAFAGFVKILGGEYKKVVFRTIDVDFNLNSPESETLSNLIMDELHKDASYGEVCIRNGRRYVPSFRETLSTDSAGFNISPEGVWVVTGGTRGIGAEVASMLIGKGVKKLVIMGKKTIPPREEWEGLQKSADSSLDERIRALLKLEKRGAHVEVYTGSINDFDRLERFFDKVRSELGPIEGVMHCAGLNRSNNPAFINKKQEDIMEVLEPKLEGTLTLHRVFEKDGLKHFILFSSVSASIPSLASGLSDYAAANAFMDYYAAYRYAVGDIYYKSIGWTNWAETGMGQTESPVYLSMGLSSMKTAEGLELLDLCLGMGQIPFVIPCMAYENLFNPAKLPKITRGKSVFSVTHTSEDKGKYSFEVLQSHTEKKQRVTPDGKAIHWLKEIFRSELGIALENLDEEKNFGDYGVDSILIAELVKKIEGVLEVKIEPSVLLEYPTLKELGEYIDQKYGYRPTVNENAEIKQSTADEITVVIAQGHSDEKEKQYTLNKENNKTTVYMDVKSESKENENIKSQGPNSMKIAVIGMACNFPLAASKDEFWENLKSGRDCITEVKKSRWDKDKYFSPDYEKGKTYCKWGGFIDDIEYFDAKYFNIDEELATHIDPIARRFMEVSVQTFRDAGYEKDEIWGKKIGVFAGTRSGNYSSKISQPIKSTIIGTGQNFIAAHISHFFNLKGPNMVVDTACSSSLVSIHLACQSLINGESDMVLAGGADILLDERTYIVLSESGAISPDGKCHTFDERANGFVPGEGCGIVLLKPLKKAEEDGDNIYAVIEASAVNNDGHTMGITTPNPVAQETVIKEALEKAGVNASTVSYIEAHGTGTMIGDPIELKALTNVFREYTQEKGFCAIGSVKTNLGHLLSAAGVASFIKVVLSIINRQIPPTLNCKKPNPRFKFDQSPFYPNISLVEWKKLAGTRRAGISSFGFGGTNAHIILAEYERKDRQKKSRSPLPPIVFNRKRYWVDSGLKPIETENTGVSSSNQFIANITNTNKNLLLNDIPTVKQERILKIIDESDEFIENNQPDADNRKRILEIVDETDRD